MTDRRQISLMATELEEVLEDIDRRARKMTEEQMDRYFKAGCSVGQFLNMEREEEFSKRILQLLEAKMAIENILGR